MAGDCIACPFLYVAVSHRCRLRPGPLGLLHETQCLGLPGRCDCPELREAEIRNQRFARREADRPVSMLVRLARRSV